jgi:predicted outer membrane repeat protein
MPMTKQTTEQRSAAGKAGAEKVKQLIAEGKLPADIYSQAGKKGGAIHADKMRIKREMTVTKI